MVTRTELQPCNLHVQSVDAVAFSPTGGDVLYSVPHATRRRVVPGAGTASASLVATPPGSCSTPSRPGRCAHARPRSARPGPELGAGRPCPARPAGAHSEGVSPSPTPAARHPPVAGCFSSAQSRRTNRTGQQSLRCFYDPKPGKSGQILLDLAYRHYYAARAEAGPPP